MVEGESNGILLLNCVLICCQLDVHQELERIVERGLAETVDPAADDEMEDEGGEGQGVYCVTCGHEVATRRAIKHMENCFNKVTYAVFYIPLCSNKLVYCSCLFSHYLYRFANIVNLDD